MVSISGDLPILKLLRKTPRFSKKWSQYRVTCPSQTSKENILPRENEAMLVHNSYPFPYFRSPEILDLNGFPKTWNYFGFRPTFPARLVL
jgi:hypothetical protein